MLSNAVYTATVFSQGSCIYANHLSLPERWLGAVRLVRFMLVPLAAGMVVVALFDHLLTAWIYLILVGINVGIAHTAVSAMWAEIYGVTNLGAIRSVSTSLSVFASALGPVTVGGLMDLGVSIERTCLLFAAYTVIGTVLTVIALARSPRSRLGNQRN